jgi:hypothetical protein
VVKWLHLPIAAATHLAYAPFPGSNMHGDAAGAAGAGALAVGSAGTAGGASVTGSGGASGGAGTVAAAGGSVVLGGGVAGDDAQAATNQENGRTRFTR